MNAKLSPAKMVGYVQTLLLTIPVSAQENSWEEIVSTVSIHIYMYIYPLFASLSLIMEFGSKSVIASGVYNILKCAFHICCYQI